MNDQQSTINDMVAAGEDLEALDAGTLKNDDPQVVVEQPPESPPEDNQPVIDPMALFAPEDGGEQQPPTEQPPEQKPPEGDGEQQPSGYDLRITELTKRLAHLQEQNEKLVEHAINREPDGGRQEVNEEPRVPFEGYDPDVAKHIGQYMKHLQGDQFEQLEKRIKPMEEKSQGERLETFLADQIEGFNPDMMPDVVAFYESLPADQRPAYEGSDGAVVGLVYKMAREGKLNLVGEQRPTQTPRPRPQVQTETGTQQLQTGSGLNEGAALKNIADMDHREWMDLQRKLDSGEVDARGLFGGG